MEEEKKAEEEKEARGEGEEEKGGAEEKEPGKSAPGEAGMPMPEPNFLVVATILHTQALVHLGIVNDMQTGERKVDLPQAKFFIDLLQILADKTKGNLQEEEDRYMNKILYELRMSYVNTSK